MIGIAGAILREQGLAQPGAKLHADFWLKTGDYVLLKVFTARDRFLFVKISELLDLETEHAAQELAYRTIGRFVPRLHGHFRRDGCSLIISDGVTHRRAQADEILDAQGKVARDLVEFFRLASERGRTEAGPGLAGEIATLNDYFSSTEHAAALARWTDDERITTLAGTRQHCDFVVTNLGVHGQELVVFDWEDYGKLSIPGFDLCVLLLSLTQFDPHAVVSLLPQSGSVPVRNDFVAACCNAIGLDVQLFAAMLPLYLAAFLYLKQDYSADIQLKTSALLKELTTLHTPPTA